MGLRESDRTILEFLHMGGEHIHSNPGTISRNVKFSGGTIRERVLVLRDVGLIQYDSKEPEGYYEITDLGVRVLRGEVSEEEVKELEQLLDQHS